MDFENAWSSIFSFSIWTFFKGAILFALGLYILFAAVVLRQVYMMTKVISNPLNWSIKIGTWVHFVLAVAVFLFAFASL